MKSNSECLEFTLNCAHCFSVGPTTPRIKVKAPISSVEAQRTHKVGEWHLQAPLLLLFLPLDHLVPWVTPLDPPCHRAPQDSTHHTDSQCSHQSPLVNPHPSNLISTLR